MSRSASVLTIGMLVQAHYRDQGRREKAEGFVEGFMPLICVIGKQIDISYLPLLFILFTHQILNADGSVRNLFTFLPLQKN